MLFYSSARKHLAIVMKNKKMKSTSFSQSFQSFEGKTCAFCYKSDPDAFDIDRMNPSNVLNLKHFDAIFVKWRTHTIICSNSRRSFDRTRDMGESGGGKLSDIVGQRDRGHSTPRVSRFLFRDQFQFKPTDTLGLELIQWATLDQNGVWSLSYGKEYTRSGYEPQPQITNKVADE